MPHYTVSEYGELGVRNLHYTVTTKKVSEVLS